MRHLLVLTFLFLFSTGAAAQAGRVKTGDPSAPDAGQTAQALFREAVDFAKAKFSEFEQKKIPYSERLREQTVREQRQLAARHAALLLTRQNLSELDLYYLGMLHWLAENQDGATENLKKFLTAENTDGAQAQAARSVLITINARRKNFGEAEKIYAEYLKTNIFERRERFKMETELAKAYFAEKQFARAAPHAEEAYRLTKESLAENESRARALAEILDSAVTVFEIYREAGNRAQAEKTLADLRKTAVAPASVGIYYYAVDNLIKYKIETGRKAEGLEIYSKVAADITRDFAAKPAQDDLARRFERRKKHYQLLGETAPALASLDRAIPGEIRSLDSLLGRVVLLDFWATWCGPCYGAFPYLIELHENFQKDGLEIIGLTRYYGRIGVKEASEAAEIEYLQQIKKDEKLPYDFLVAKDSVNQFNYGAMALPTTVIIDRKGVIRYLETGTSDAREREIREWTAKLINEK
jgi:cytochrome c biogenesis protein CcmG, thiol:disulfide interchange protein DsbE